MKRGRPKRNNVWSAEKKENYLTEKILKVISEGFNPTGKKALILRIDLNSPALREIDPKDLEKMVLMILPKLKKRKEIKEQFCYSPEREVCYIRTPNRSLVK
jgi:hypothetical protein